MKKLFVIVAAVALTGCFASKASKGSKTSKADRVPTPTQADVARVEKKFPGCTLAELSEGHTLYKEHCGTCHELKSPMSEREQDWKDIVPEMAKKANKNGMVINNQSEKLILKYVIAMCEQESKK